MLKIVVARAMGRTDDQAQDFSALMRAAAYSSLLNLLAPLVRQLVRQRLRFLQPQDVDDLVQDVLLSVHAARATYNPSRPFHPWLGAIVGPPAGLRILDVGCGDTALLVALAQRGACATGSMPTPACWRRVARA